MDIDSKIQNKEPIIKHKNGGLYILCADDGYVGMYSGGISDMLECSLVKANFILEILEKISVKHKVNNKNTITHIIFNLSDKIADPPKSKDINQYLSDKTITQPIGIITINDISEILNITEIFAHELLDNFNKKIYNQNMLNDFLVSVNIYLKRFYQGKIPEHHKKQLSNKNQFTSEKLEEILRQEAPKELAKTVPSLDNKPSIVSKKEFPSIEALISHKENKKPDTPIKNNVEEEKEAQTNEKTTFDDVKLKTYTVDTFTQSPFFKSTSEMFQKFLEINEEEAEFILTTPPALADFFNLKTINAAKEIITEAANGNVEPLLQGLNQSIEGVLKDIADNTMRRMLEGHNSIMPRISHPDKSTDNNAPSVGNNEEAKSLNQPKSKKDALENTKQNIAQEDDPQTLSETLLYVFKHNERITAKSLLEVFKTFNSNISKDLARYIIEEGKYGGAPPNDHRIMDKKMVDKLVFDIEASGTLKTFVKKYLEKINNDLKSMLGSG